jgi:tetratricopeptide (TPR) repeat protein
MKADWHIPREMMRRFHRSELSREELKAVTRHLLTECPTCRELSQAVRRPDPLAADLARAEGSAPAEVAGPLEVEAAPPPALASAPTSAGGAARPGGSETYARAFRRLFEGLEEKQWQVAHDRLRGAGQWALLQPHPAHDRQRMVREDGRLHTWGLFERLLEVCRGLVWSDHRAALDVAELALTVAGELDVESFGGERVADFRVAALGAVGNCRRLVSDYAGAKDAFREAWQLIKEGTGDPLERARLLSLEASMRRDVGELDRAAELLDMAGHLYEQVGDTQQMAGVLITQSDILGERDAAEGVERSRRALRLLDGARAPRLELCARHNLIWYLAESGEAREALTLLEAARPLYREFPEPWVQLRLLWLEGLIARTLGDLEEAESIFAKLWQEFRARGSQHSLTLISIDLAAIYVERDKLDAGLELLSQVYGLLSEWGMHSEGLGIWLLMQRALAKRSAKATVFREATRYFRQAWNTPLHFKE